MTATRTIATVTAEQGYDGLQRGLRARADELQLSRTQIEELAGLTGGHASKLLAPYPIKAIGRTTLGPMLYALKLKLLIVPDDSIEWREEPDKKNLAQARDTKPLGMGIANIPEVRAIRRQVLQSTLSKFGKKGGRKSAQLRAGKSPGELSRMARKAWRTKRRKAREHLARRAAEITAQLDAASPHPCATHPAGAAYGFAPNQYPPSVSNSSPPGAKRRHAQPPR
jgi:hypothetical protein